MSLPRSNRVHHQQLAISSCQVPARLQLSSQQKDLEMVSTTSDPERVSWPLLSFAINNGFKLSDNVHLVLDRANAEFGLVTLREPGLATLEQFPENGEPIFFQLSRVRAACSRSTPRLNHRTRKACVLLQHCQIDLEFATADLTQDFMETLKRRAKDIRNAYFEVYEVPWYDIFLLSCGHSLTQSGTVTLRSLDQTLICLRLAY